MRFVLSDKFFVQEKQIHNFFLLFFFIFFLPRTNPIKECKEIGQAIIYLVKSISN